MHLARRLLFFAAVLGIFFATTAQQKQGQPSLLRLTPGPHLFIDEHLIGEQSRLLRTVNVPVRAAQPVVTGRLGGDDCFQPYLTVLRDSASNLFRLWYGIPESASQTHIAYMESRDGRTWIRPHRVLKDPFPMNFGVSVIDRGASFPRSDQRFVFASYYENGMMIATSPDGLEWKAVSPLPRWQAGSLFRLRFN